MNNQLDYEIKLGENELRALKGSTPALQDMKKIQEHEALLERLNNQRLRTFRGWQEELRRRKS